MGELTCSSEHDGANARPSRSRQILAGKAVAEEPGLASAMNSLAGSSAAPDSKPVAEAENRGSGPAEAASTQKVEGQPTARQLTAAEVQFAIAFTRIVSVLSKSIPYRKMPLGALEGLVVPMITTGQFAMMDAEVNGQLVPVALAFWVNVSPEVDQRLSDETVAVPRLAPNEWCCGDIPWLLDVVGHRTAVEQLTKQLNKGPFTRQEIKVRRKSSRDGGQVTTLRQLVTRMLDASANPPLSN